jgi:putative hemolysin
MEFTDKNADVKVGQRILSRNQNRLAYQVRMAQSADDVRTAQTLRFLVFNLELNEGLERSYETCRDSDPFDDVCDHLLVENVETNEVVGTYRFQTGKTAENHLGYYSAQEFDFAPYEPVREQIVELGRACVHLNHRNLIVLSLLWKGIAAYARLHKARYLIGCSSLSSQDPSCGASVYSTLIRKHLIEARFQTVPLPAWICPLNRLHDAPLKIPKLLGAYLSLGARICGPPALDPVFKTIDFLTMIDLQALPPETVQRYLT